METHYPTDLVASLLRDQHPDLADLPLREVTGGWDNQMWRLGDDLAVRLPRTERAPRLLLAERRWLPELLADLPLATPVPVRDGEPSAAFAHPWNITRWVPGSPADVAPVTSGDAAQALGRFLYALHRPAPAQAPHNPDRGVPLAQVPADVPAMLAGIGRPEDAPALRSIWEQALAAPQWQGPRLWLHGDLHPANVVTDAGRLTGVLDFGELCGGDPATDLSAAWLLVPAGSADPCLAAYGEVDVATRARARGWALFRALGLVMIGRNGRLGRPGGKPTWEPAGHAALDRLLA